MMPCSSMRRTAAAASSSGVDVFGVRVMTSATGMPRKSGVRSMRRVKSPAVTTPTSAPVWSTTATVPRRSARRTTQSRIGRSGARSGRSAVSMTSATRWSSLRPSAPPGWSAAKSSRRKPFTSSNETARASPRASATVVLAVGASVSGQASSATAASSTTTAWRARTEPGSPVTAMMGTPRRCSCSTRSNSSSVEPLLESRMATSSRPTIPKSPCNESTGWRNAAGVPVEVKVAAILRAMSPDFPTPLTITRPFACASSVTARAKVSPRRWASAWIAAASSARTRRPRSTRSERPLCDIAAFLQILRDHAIPDAAGLENRLRHLAYGALAARCPGDERCDGLDLVYRVRHGDGQTDATEQRQVREVVAHERTRLPGDAAAGQDLLERGELPGAVVLHDIVDPQLLRAEGCGVGVAASYEHHGDAGPLQHLHAQAVLDVEALELDRVVGQASDVDAAVGHDAVHVEPDELDAFRKRLAKHWPRVSRGGSGSPDARTA